MSVCKCGTEKKSTSPDIINPNEIGVLCFLFGLEGELCRLLDLVPEAIKKIVQLDPDKGNADEIFLDILKKVAITSFGIIFDQAGNINVGNFCQSEPPPEPDQINYSDIFIFIAELVPFLDRFFKFNEILVGDSTRLLDKIIATWLRKKYFDLCDCKKCLPNQIDENDFNPPAPIPDLTCFDGSTAICKPIYAKNNTTERIISSCNGFWSATQTIYGAIDGVPNRFKNTYSILIPNSINSSNISNNNDIYKIRIGLGNYITISEKSFVLDIESGKYIENPSPNLQLFYSKDGINFIPSDGNFPNAEFICPPPPPPIDEKPRDFCALFPLDPICLEENNCNVEYVICLESIGCNGLSKPIRLTLNTSGTEEAIAVNVGNCQGITSQELILLKCDDLDPPPPPPPDIYGCTDPNASNFNPEANIDDGSCEYPPTDCNFIFTDNLTSNVDSAVQYINEEAYTIEMCVNELLLPNSTYQNLAQQYPECDFVSIYISAIGDKL